jgi:hypothetical protein
MARIAAFLVTVAVVLVGVAALDRWIDPFLDRYDPAVLTAALEQSPQCYVGWDTFSTRAWPAMKLDLFRRRNARVVVVGTSRAAKIEAHPGERGFANLLVPGTGPETLAPLFRRLHALGHRRLTVYLGVEPFWFGRGWRTQTFFTHSYLRNAKYLLSEQTLNATLRELRRTPGVLRHPRALRPWAVYRGHGACVVSRGDSVLAGASDAWAPDGGLWYNDEVTGAGPVHGVPLVEVQYGAFTGQTLNPDRLEALRDALEVARGYRWKVVGVALPFGSEWVRRLSRAAATRDVFTGYRRTMPGLFERYGFRFLDLTDVRRVPCPDDAFSHEDGGHPNAMCGRRIRRLLDAAAAAG